MPVPSALDLPDVAAADVAPTRPLRGETKVPTIIPAPVGSQGDDIEDWI